MKPEKFKNIAPKLHELKQLKSGFTVPKNYFETVENNVYKKLTHKESTFSIPDGYFDTIENRVFKKINSETKIIDFKTKIKTLIPIIVAASFLLFITLQLLNKPNQIDMFASLKTSEIENWIENGEIEINTYDITAIYEELDFEGLELNQPYNDDNLIEYLDTIDVESLILTN